ncbi:MAG TPA: response regulator [Thermoleophilaceae bacterium]
MTVQVTAIEILLVEDSEADIVLTEEALKDAKVMNRLSVVRDGEQALLRARRLGAYEGEPEPDLILLDLNLPIKDGREVLRELKEDPDLRRIPVVVLTTSAAERDILAAYDQHVNAYITKPVDIEQFVAVVRATEDFWLSVVRLPNGTH